MKKSLIYNIIFTGALIFTISGCSHETDTFDGPSLVDRFGPFSVLQDLEVSQSTVDFAAGETAFFTAEFNKNVNWVLEITGTVSGAVKRIEGFERTLNATTALWDGGTTDLPFFTSEVCDVVLTIPEEPSYLGTATIEALSTRSYADVGVLVTDFETAQPGVVQRNFDFKFSALTGRRDDIPAAEGDFFLFLEGTNNGAGDPFFIGLYEILASVTGETYIPVPTTIPEDLYFNFFVYSDGRPYGIAIVDFAVDTDDDGVFNESVDAVINPFGETRLDWVGWRQISFPMSTLGNITQEQLEKLVALRLIMISDDAQQPNPPEAVAYGADFMIFTSGGPLEL
ncbi:MAG: hypothetical protein AAF573_19165 [Bacteroidota bacterium]